MVDMPLPVQPLAGLPLVVPPVSPSPGDIMVLSGPRSATGPEIPRQITPQEDARLRAESTRFEAAFLAEMLRYTGLGRMPESFNGGAGEAAFSGSLVQEYANLIAATGTLGISDQIYKSLLERSRSGLGQ
jgi:peptidoglycan hydrolase FlgJ